MKVTYGGKEMNLVGKQPNIGDKINVKGVGIDFVPFTNRNRTKKTLLSFFPSINTTVCDEQTRKIIEISQKHPDVQFISMSLDLPTAIKAWCAANHFNNVTIISDYQKRTFCKKYGLLVDELKLMARGIMVLDNQKKLQYIDICSEIKNLPNFDEAERHLA